MIDNRPCTVVRKQLLILFDLINSDHLSIIQNKQTKSSQFKAIFLYLRVELDMQSKSIGIPK